MKTLTIISCFLLVSLTSCKGTKSLQATGKVVTHHTIDSVVVNHRTVIDTVVIPSQEVKASVSMEDLKKVGEYVMGTGKGLTTKVIYNQSTNTLDLESKLDSLTELYQHQLIDTSRFKTITKTIVIPGTDLKSDKGFPYFFTLVTIIVVMVLAYLIINKLKQ